MGERRPGGSWIVVGLLLLAFGLMLSSSGRKSVTVDEQSHLFRGIAYLKTGATHFLWGHPLLASSMSALPLLTEPNLQLPRDHPSWAEGDWAVAGDRFLWQINEDPHRLIFLGRLPTLWLTLLLGALLYAWGRLLAGPVAGTAALAFLMLDPNVLAHGRLVTSDLPLTLFLTLAVYGYWRWAGTDQARFLVLSGLGLGAAGATKFNAGLLLPAIGLLALLLVWQRGRVRPLLALVLAGGVAGLVIWAVYRFSWQPWPAAALWQDLTWEFDYLSRPHGAYLAGRYAETGWWYYFPVAFLVKTPLPTLLLLAAAGIAALGPLRTPGTLRHIRGGSLSIPFLLLPPLVYFAISLTSPLNIGYRHLIPMLPFLLLFAVTTLSGGRRVDCPEDRRWPASLSGWTGGLLALLGGTLLLNSLFTWPDYLPYFNLLAGGPSERWRLLSDSNIDWGQDLPALAAWQAATGERVKLSYFGVAHPSAYGIAFDALPTWAPGPEQRPPDRQPFNPLDPAPGTYAISVTHLHGLVLGADRDIFGWFREREPFQRLGGTIFLYQVEPRGEPVGVAFAGLRPADLSPTLAAHVSTNDVRVRWLDSRTSFIWPAGGGWLAVAAEEQPAPALKPYWPSEPVARADDQLLYQLPSPPDLPWAAPPAEPAEPVGFLGYTGGWVAPGEIELVTGWRVLAETERPLKIFVHAVDGTGQIVGQWDGLDLDPAGLVSGDQFLQLHRFAVPETVGPIQLTTGIYDGETLMRLSGPIPLGEPLEVNAGE